MTITDVVYRDLIRWVMDSGQGMESRNGRVQSSIDVPPVIFTETPLVTIRRTAWRKAILEMEWFLSGKDRCPSALMDWWDGQLNADGDYLDGYGAQLRHWNGQYDQMAALMTGLMDHPNSRRHVVTTWHPIQMANITVRNGNPATPTTCHTTLLQAFVREETLHLTSYQRSADLLLGVPHNWLQSWALLLWLAAQTGLQVGSLRWLFGDAHLYLEDSHRAVIDALLAHDEPTPLDPSPVLHYGGHPTDPFRAADFVMEGRMPAPWTTFRPVRL